MKTWELWVLLVYALFLVWGGLTLAPFGVSTLVWLACVDVTTKERLGAKPPPGVVRSARGARRRGDHEGAGETERKAAGHPRDEDAYGRNGQNDEDTAGDDDWFSAGYKSPHPDVLRWAERHGGVKGKVGGGCRDVLCQPVRLRPYYDKHDVSV